MNTMTIVLIIIATFASLAFAKQLNKRKTTAARYTTKPALCTAAELKFLRILDAAVDAGHRVFAMVRLIDVIQPAAKDFAARNRVIQKHLDFLICDRETTRPLYAIELNDSSHNTDSRKIRDQFLEESMKSAGIPLIFQKATARYDLEALKREISQRLNPPPL